MTRAFVAIALLLGGCGQSTPPNDDTIDGFNARLAEVYHTKPKHLSRAYAIMKVGAAGPDWLATIHGYPDNRAVCEDLIAPYNENEGQSVLPGRYSCEEL